MIKNKSKHSTAIFCMNKKLWEPSKTLKLNSNLLKFEKYISNRFKKKFNQEIMKKFIIGQ